MSIDTVLRGVSAVDRITNLTAKIDEGLNEFGLLSGLLVGGGIHVGSNYTFRKMLQPGSWAQKIGSSVFKAGMRDARAGKALHPAVRGAMDVLAGPELGHLYQAGMKSSPEMVRAAYKGHKVADGAVGAGAIAVVIGKRSKVADMVMNALPRGGKSKLAHAAGAAVAGAGAAMVDPVWPSVNAIRTGIAHTPIGNAAMKAAFKKGMAKGPQEGIVRHVQDLVVSPSLNVVRDAGSTFRDVPLVEKKVKGRVVG